MPIYESISSDKNAVILEIGSAFTRCGFASELTPRAIIRSRFYSAIDDKFINLYDIHDPDKLTFALKDFLQKLYFKYLAVNPKDRKVVVVEYILESSLFRNQLIKVLFRYLDVPTILIIPHHIAVLSTLGINTALILDVGYKEAVVLPVIESITLLDCIQFAPLGSKSIHFRILDELEQRKAVFKIGNEEKFFEKKDVDEDIIEDIKIKTCFVTPFERGTLLAQESRALEQQKEETCPSEPELECAITKPPKNVRYPFHGDKMLTIPGSLRESVCEVLFEMYGEEHTLPTLIIDSLMKCSLDSRKALACNIVMIGGTAMLPGLRHRLYKEIKYLASQSDRYGRAIHFSDHFKLHQLPCKANIAAWLGASIFSTSDLLTIRSITYEQFAKNNYKVTDWNEFSK